MKKHTNPSWRGGALALALCGLCAGLTAGCEIFMQKPLCPELRSCGGDPTGNWMLAANTTSASCSEDLYFPPTDTRLVMGDVPAARIPPPEQALFDWCLLLVTNGGMEIQAKPPRFSVESPHVGAASVKLGKFPEGQALVDDPFSEGIGQYTVGTTRTGTYVLDLPAFCVREFGARSGRIADPVNDPMGPKVDVCKQLQVPVGESGLGEGAYRNTTCIPNPADIKPDKPDSFGCLCAFDVSAAGGSAGQYSIDKEFANTLKHLPNSNFPQRVTYCREGDRLQLTGKDGAYLFDQFGLRTLDLVKAPDVMQSPPTP